MTEARNFLVVSDLHLSEGRHPETGRISRTEDFFVDEEFCAFLRHHLDASIWPDTRWHLLINGDFVDFLQVISVPEDEDTLLSDPKYGLKTGVAETIWKLGRIVLGHEDVFACLAEFASRNRITILVGNHDIEFAYSTVQDALRETLCRLTPKEKQEAVQHNLDFETWFFFDGSVYIEHGQQYDPVNSFRYLLDPRLPHLEHLADEEADHIDLPLGSLFVRYMFNQVETSSPFADNIKPPTRFLKWFVTKHPLRAIRFLFRGGSEMLRRVRRKWHCASEEAYADRRAAHLELLAEKAASLENELGSDPETNWSRRLKEIDGSRSAPILATPLTISRRFFRLFLGPIITPALLVLQCLIVLVPSLELLEQLLLPILPSWLTKAIESLFQEASPFLRSPIDLIEGLFVLELLAVLVFWIAYRKKQTATEIVKRRFRRKAAFIESVLHPRYILMGHTHEPDLWRLTPASEYFNTGTWTKVFSSEEQLIREEKELTFVRILQTRKGLKARLLKWEGGRNEARLVYLFSE